MSTNLLCESLGFWNGHQFDIDIDNFRANNNYVGIQDIFPYEEVTNYIKGLDIPWLDFLKEDNAFGVVCRNVDSTVVSRDLLDSILELEFLTNHCSFPLNAMRILDIGAGYGRLAHRLTTAYPGAYVYCTDAVGVSLKLCQTYIQYRNLTRTEVVCPSDLDKIGHIDLATNIHSWSECPRVAINWWLDFLVACKVKNLFVIPHPWACELCCIEDMQSFRPEIEAHGYKLAQYWRPFESVPRDFYLFTISDHKSSSSFEAIKKKRVVSFTISQDEPLFEPLWRAFYEKVGDVVVYDPRITPGLPLGLGDVSTEDKQVLFVTNAIRHFLNAGYDVVLCPDIDEFLIPSNGQSLSEFCQTFEGDYVQAQGYQIVHQYNKELPANFHDPLNDRSTSFVSEAYTKVLITKKPLIYSRGRHYAYIPGTEHDFEQRIKEINSNIDLVHLKFIDFEYDIERWNERAQRCVGMNKFSREQFSMLYATGQDPVAGWIYWEGEPLSPKAHWREALKLPNIFEGIHKRSDMFKILHRLNATRICEIGVRNGEHLRELLIPSVREVIAVDIWKETGVRSENDECYSQLELDQQCSLVAAMDFRIIIDRCSSAIAAEHYLNSYFDFVYIDADHTESAVSMDLRAWWPKVRRGGVLAGHDFYDVSTRCKDGAELTFGVVAAVNRFVAENDLQLYLDSEGDWFIYKSV